VSLDDTSTELVLPTFAVLARFRETAADGEQAVAQVRERLRSHDEPVHEITVERQEGPQDWMVVARFVLVSVDAHTAIAGLQETLTSVGVPPDEVWADAQVA
jgi:N-dimethylarginine dimethylaminohydrolase